MSFDLFNFENTGGHTPPSDSLLSYFPYEIYHPRDAQVKILTEIEKAIKRGKKFIIVQAPTGVGKSAVSVTIGRYFNSAYICTSQKSLQEQYILDFPEIKKTKGRKNFQCLELYDYTLGDANLTCDLGKCTYSGNELCKRRPIKKENDFFAGASAEKGNLYWQDKDTERCEYWVNKMDGLNAHTCCHNYKYLLTESSYVGDFGKRDVIIADEGHNAESNIIDMIKVDITLNLLQKIEKYTNVLFNFKETDKDSPNSEKLKIHYDWVVSLKGELPAVLEIIKFKLDSLQEKFAYLKEIKSEDELRAYFSTKYPDKEERTNILESRAANGDPFMKTITESLKIDISKATLDVKAVGSDYKHIENLNTRLEEFIYEFEKNNKWVVLEGFLNNKREDGLFKITFQPLFVHQYAQKYFFRLGDVVILISATILNPEKLAHDLGIKREEYKYIAIEPQFPKESNLLFNLAVANFETNMEESYQEVETFWKEVVEKIDLILETHSNQKGIIHGGTHEICNKIKRYSKYSSRIITHSDKNADNLNYRQQKIDEHCEGDEPTVLCSPSMFEGVDLRDNFSRFQILVKMPYPDIGNEWVKARIEADRRYFKHKTAVTICQAIGRSVRNSRDWCITYTLDSRFKDYMRWGDYRLTELFTRHEMPLEELETVWNHDKLVKLLSKIKRKEKKGKHAKHVTV